MNIKEQMIDDVLRTIGVIVEEIGLSISRATIERALYMCELYGSSPARFLRLPGKMMGRCLTEEDGAIDVDARRCGAHLGPTILHELTHRLSFCSPRFEHLNSPHMAAYDRDQFQEMVASGVEWLFYQLQRFAEICASPSLLCAG